MRSHCHPLRCNRRCVLGKEILSVTGMRHDSARHIPAISPCIQPIRPSLHHRPPLFNIGGMVIRSPHLIRIDVRQLDFNPFLWIPQLVQCRGNRGADTMACQPVGISHAPQSTIERVFTDALLEVTAMGKQIVLCWTPGLLLQEIFHDLDSLPREAARHRVEESCFPDAT